MKGLTLYVAVLISVVLSIHGAVPQLEDNEHWVDEENAEKFRESRSLFSHHHNKHLGKSASPKQHRPRKVYLSHRLNPVQTHAWSKQIHPIGWSKRVHPKDWSKRPHPKEWSKKAHGKHLSKDVHRKYWPKRVHPKDWSQKDSSKKVYPRDWSIQVHHKDWYRTVHQKDWFKKIRPTEWLSDIGSAFHYSKVYPGTNWCGDGHRAKNWADLGRKWRPDTCCRSHDLCSHAVEAGKVKYGIKNHGLFTWSHCDCDREFYDCLKQARTIDSDIIGVAYFDVLNNYCIYEDYPETCKKFLLFKVKCSKVKTKSKIWKKRKIDLVYFGKARD